LQTFLSTDKHQQGIIFCRTKATAQRLAQRLARSGLSIDALHGDLSQSKRDKVMKRFKSRQLQAVVATDVAARGIDVKDLQYVIHYNLPEQLAYYTHRSGRAARAGKQGISLCLVAPQAVRRVKQIARELGLQFQQLEGPSRQELDKRRVLEWAEKVIAASSSTRTNPALVQLAEETFEGLSKQALITKLVAHLLGWDRDNAHVVWGSCRFGWWIPYEAVSKVCFVAIPNFALSLSWTKWRACKCEGVCEKSHLV